MRSLTIPIAVTLSIVFLLVIADTPIVMADTPTSPPDQTPLFSPFLEFIF